MLRIVSRIISTEEKEEGVQKIEGLERRKKIKVQDTDKGREDKDKIRGKVINSRNKQTMMVEEKENTCIKEELLKAGMSKKM